MDFLWTPYGLPMDSLWNNTLATPEQYRSISRPSRHTQVPHKEFRPNLA